MEKIHDFGIGVILQIQSAFKNYEHQILFLSRVGDPRNAFLIYFPIAYHLNCGFGLSVLWSFVFSEWLNLILKWILRGERPYWWVHENAKWQNVDVKQFELTCETGPGSPSGHSMVTAAVFFIIFTNLNQFIQRCNLVKRNNCFNVLLTLLCWLAFAILLLLVSFSRVFIATHFPHQVVLGALCGVVMAYCLKSSELSRETRLLYYLALSVGLFGSTVLLHKLLSMAIYDPSVTIKNAQKWCVNPSYIHLNTTPFYALVRDLGAVLGVGVSYSVINKLGQNNVHFKEVLLTSMEEPKAGTVQRNIFERFAIGLVSLILLQLVESVPISQSSWMFFYISGFVRNVVNVVLVMVLVPLLTQMIVQVFSGRSHSKNC